MIKKLRCDVFTADVWVVVGPDNLEAYYKKRDVGEGREGWNQYNGFVQAIDQKEKTGEIFREYLIYLEDKDDFYTLLHESVHLVNHILRDRNAFYNWDKDELFAYYQTYWFKKIWRLVNKKKGQK